MNTNFKLSPTMQAHWHIWSGTRAIPVAGAEPITDPLAAFSGLGLPGEFRDGYFYVGGKPSLPKQIARTVVNAALAPVYLGHFMVYELAGQVAELAMLGPKDNLIRGVWSYFYQHVPSINNEPLPLTDEIANLHEQWMSDTITKITPGLKALKSWERNLGWLYDLFDNGNPLMRSLAAMIYDEPEAGVVQPSPHAGVPAVYLESRSRREEGFVPEWRRLIARAEETLGQARLRLQGKFIP